MRPQFVLGKFLSTVFLFCISISSFSTTILAQVPTSSAASSDFSNISSNQSSLQTSSSDYSYQNSSQDYSYSSSDYTDTSSSFSSLSSNYSNSSNSFSQSSSQSSTPTVTNISANFIEPLDPSLNSDAAKDRINVVFYQNEADADINSVKQVAIKAIDINNQIDSSYFDEFAPYQGLPPSFGLFGVETFRDNINKINFWFYNNPVPSGQSFEFEEISLFEPNRLGLDYVLPVRLLPIDFNSSPEESRSNANFAYINYNSDFSISRFSPGSIRLFFFPGDVNNPFDPGENVNGPVLTHELGHALFALGDEYQEPGSIFGIRAYPNCSADLSEATTWWSDKIGEVDPAFYAVRDKYISDSVNNPYGNLRYNNGQLQIYRSNSSSSSSSFSSSLSGLNNQDYFERVFDNYKFRSQAYNSSVGLAPFSASNDNWQDVNDLNEVYNEENFRIQYVNQECLSGDNNGGYKPTVDSLMRFNDPVLGSVNRRQADKVFGLFSGTNIPTPKLKPTFITSNELVINDLSFPTCNIVIKTTGQRVLQCSLANSNTNITRNSNSSFQLGLFPAEEVLSNLYGIENTDPAFVDCRLSDDLANLICDPIDLTGLPFDVEYSLVFFFNPTGEIDAINEQFPYLAPLQLSENFSSPVFQLDEVPVTREVISSSSSSSISSALSSSSEEMILSSSSSFSSVSSSLQLNSSSTSLVTIAVPESISSGSSSSSNSTVLAIAPTPAIVIRNNDNFVRLTSPAVLTLAINDSQTNLDNSNSNTVSSSSPSFSNSASSSRSSSSSSKVSSISKSSLSSVAQSSDNSVSSSSSSSQVVASESSNGVIAGIVIAVVVAAGVIGGVVIVAGRHVKNWQGKD